MEDLIFTLDPGSLRSGFAVLTMGGQLREAGLLLPDKRAAASEFRIEVMCRDLHDLLIRWDPSVVVLEWTSGKVNTSRHKGAGAGLAVHGAATGALWREVEAWRRSLPAERQSRVMVELIRENQWTRGTPKTDRQAAVAQEFPQYDPTQDIGGDLADAIGLATWWLRNRAVKMLQGETA